MLDGTVRNASRASPGAGGVIPGAEGLVVGEAREGEDRARRERVGVEARRVAQEELEAIELREVSRDARVVAPGRVGGRAEASRAALTRVEPHEPEHRGAIERVGLRVRDGKARGGHVGRPSPSEECRR